MGLSLEAERECQTQSLVLNRKLFATIGKSPTEYLQDFCPSPKSFQSKEIDVLNFCERTWCNEFYNVPFKAKVCRDNVAAAEFDSYEDWLKQLPKETKTRLMKAREKGLEVKIIDPNARSSPFSDVKEGVKLAEGIWKIYNETPIRQFRRFNHYGVSLESVQQHVFTTDNIIIGAYIWVEEKSDGDVFLKHKLVGFVELQCGEDTGVFGQILSLVSFRDVMPNNALIAKAVKICSDRNLHWLVYARMGNHPSLDVFKRNNGFKKVEIKRFYVPLTLRGRIFLLFSLQRSFKDGVPMFLKSLGFHLYNLASRIGLRFNGKMMKREYWWLLVLLVSYVAVCVTGIMYLHLKGWL
ncbi:MAG: hypothetical protein ABSB71_07815 [Candidatus Bathyarchaeia archaeon]|jgi:hypothetical protein